MLNLTLVTGSNPHAAAGYFSAVDEYYEEGQGPESGEIARQSLAEEGALNGQALDQPQDHPGQRGGRWQGRGAAALGLHGVVERGAFRRLLDGQLPDGQRIARSFDAQSKRRRMALDLTFSAPKSVSLQALVAGDMRVVTAHDRAVAAALEQAEALAQTRRKVQGVSQRERTGNLVIAKYRHELSRARDPQLHTHAVLLNLTQRADGAWRALANEDLFHARKAIDGVYQVELARELQALGYVVRVVDAQGNFELDHFTRAQVEAFSARGQSIEATLATRGKTRAQASSAEKQAIALATRPRKQEGGRESLRAGWLQRCHALGIDLTPPAPSMGQSRGRWLGQGAGPGAETSPDVTVDRGAAHSDAASAAGDGKRLGDVLGRMLGPRGSAAAAALRKRSSLAPRSGVRAPPKLTPVQALVQYAIRHLSERESVVDAATLEVVALQRAVGLADTHTVRQEIARLVTQGALIPLTPRYRAADARDGIARTAQGWCQYHRAVHGLAPRAARAAVQALIDNGTLLELPARYTTHAAIQREKAILTIERAGRDALVPLVSPHALPARLAPRRLTSEQRSAIGTMVASPHRVVGVQGDAGTGKTVAVRCAVELIEQAVAPDGQPYRTLALAPYGNQVKALRQQGLPARTLASLLHDRARPIDARTVVLLDEAGVVGARQMVGLMRIVERANARLVLIGDTKQLAAIEAGKPFADLQAAGMQTARVTEIQRQRDPELRRAVAEAAAGRMAPSLARVPHIEEHPQAARRHAAMAAAYLALPAQERADTLLVVGTNDARHAVNALARQGLGLQGVGKLHDTLTRADMTAAQRRFAGSYAPGMVVQAERDHATTGLVRGRCYRVTDVLTGNRLALEGSDGASLTVDPRQVRDLTAYWQERTELAVGDIVRITRNAVAPGLTIGDRLRVQAIEDGRLILSDVVTPPAPNPAAGNGPGTASRSTTRSVGEHRGSAWTLSTASPLPLEHGYASTVHSAQGLTCERVLIGIDTRSRTISRNLYYVALSRARQQAVIYTDSRERLPLAIALPLVKESALQVSQRSGLLRSRLAREPLDLLRAPRHERAEGPAAPNARRPALATAALRPRAPRPASIDGVADGSTRA